MELQARVSGSAKKKHFESTKEIVSAPIPGLGLAVPGIFKLGLVAAYNVGFEATASGNANVNFGFKAKLADSTGVTLDLRNPSASSAKGFQGATFTPIFEVGKLTSDILVTAKSEAELTFGIELVKVAQFDVALKLNAPEVNVAAKAGRGTFSNSIPYCFDICFIHTLTSEQTTKDSAVGDQGPPRPARRSVALSVFPWTLSSNRPFLAPRTSHSLTSTFS